MSDVIRVCFVCLGNICRSPTAEAVFRQHVNMLGLSDRFEIDSAGTGDWHVGEPAHRDTRATAKKRGIEITHRARHWKRGDFERFDWIIAMDRSNLANLNTLAVHEEHVNKVHLFRSFEPDVPTFAEVPDPYYTGEFDLVFDICERASEALLTRIRNVHGF
jgi:protein-tyrosine phosphatase